MALRISSPLDDEIESRITEVIGCCISVHRALGPGLLENTYAHALCVEFREVGLSYDRERRFPVLYKGHCVSEQRLDLIVCGQIVVEIKAVDHLAEIHRAQVMSYLRVAGLRVGLLVNFNVPVLRDGVKRLIL
jgi:GxxExxY protein